MHLRAMTRAASTAFIAALMLTSCSGDPEATPTPSDSPSQAAAFETPEPSESATPEAETAEQFIRRWPVVETAMINSGDTTEYRTITKNCEPCDGLADQIEDFYAKGGYAKTDDWEVVSIKKIGKAGGRTEYRVRTVAQPTEFKKSSSAQVTTLDGGELTFRVFIKQNSAGWLLAEYLNEDTS